MTLERGRHRQRPRTVAAPAVVSRRALLQRALVRLAVVGGVAATLAGAPLPAQGSATPSLDRRADLFADRHQVSGGYGDWRSVGLRLSVPAGTRDTWFVEVLQRSAFGDAGTYVSAANQHVWGERVYSYLGVGGGSGDFVLPDLRLDASLSTKWGRRRALVTTLGTTVVDAKLGYRDVGGFGALTAYLSPLVVAEGGVRITRSTPGDVDAVRGNAAITLGRQGKAVVVLRGSSGREGFQLLGADAAVRRFTSHEGAASWRQWLGPYGGVLLQGEHYQNPFYRRTGVTLGVFAHW